MLDSSAIAAAEAYVERIERLVERLQYLHRFSTSEAIEFIERFGAAAVDSAVDCASRETPRTQQ